MSRILMLVADQREIQSLLDKTPCQQLSSNLFHYETNSLSIDILITGWGESKARQTTEEYLCKDSLQTTKAYDLWINPGIAGAFSSKISLHQCYSIHSVGCIEKDPVTNTWRQSTPPLPLQANPDIPLAALHTAPVPVKSGLNHQFDLVDMEGYTFALLARKYKTPLIMIKIASDYPNSASSLLIRLHLPSLAQKLALTIDKILKEPSKITKPIAVDLD